VGTNSEPSKNVTTELERSVVISDYLNLSAGIIETIYDLAKETPTLKISGSVEEIMFALSAAYTALDKNCNFTAIYNELNRIHGDRSLLEQVPEVANDSDGMDVDMLRWSANHETRYIRLNAKGKSEAQKLLGENL
tara:strand:+ start:58 stop:465 length:408 start_codon:yes stop_codon:yes gene_type:complete